jgi:Heterokaryon incompatibility protein (HET)
MEARNDILISPGELRNDRYVYQPLESSDQIRVLELLPTVGDRLECHISNIQLAHERPQAVRYEALSYVWGSSEKPFKILVRSKSGEIKGYIPLTASLNHALRDLQGSPEITSKVFWIDQISINQDENEEKGHQVAQMGRIFKNASRVITYIGQKGPKDEEAIELITLLHLNFKPNYPLIIENGWVWAADNYETLPIPSLNSKYYDHPGWSGLLDIALGEWTQRLWMVQENVLNTNNIMMRGQTILDWIAVAAIPVLCGCYLIPLKKHLHLWDQSRVASNSVINSVYTTWVSKVKHWGNHTKSSLPQSLSLDYNMLWYTGLECADPRDHIFALLSISRDAEKLNISPNYDQSVPEVFINTTIMMMDTKNTSLLLHHAAGSMAFEEPGFPSWCLHWKFSVQQLLNEIDFHSHPMDKGYIRFECGNSVLVQKGRIVDELVLTTPAVETAAKWLGSLDENLHRQAIKYFAEINELLNRVGFNLATLSAVHRAMLADEVPSHESKMDEQDRANHLWHLLSWWRRLIYDIGVKSFQDMKEQIDILEHMALRVGSMIGERGEFERGKFGQGDVDIKYRKPERIIWGGRCLCVTAQNRICNTVARARNGDFVALLECSRVPFVLRRDGDCYNVIGDIWVPDIMHGEAYKGVLPELVDEEIRLR